MKILKIHMRIRDNHEHPRIPHENQEDYLNLKFNARITKTPKSFRNSWENYENHENLRIPIENNDNHKNARIPCENHENHENLRIAMENH